MSPNEVGPPAGVLHGFGIDGPAEPLAGGQGTAWRAGDVVLKPTDFVPEAEWRGRVLSRLAAQEQVRVARPVLGRAGTWTVDGWEAWQAVSGEPDPRRVDDVLAAGEAFHHVVADVERPSFLTARTDPWTYGDRVAWNELPVEGAVEWLALLRRLSQLRRPVDLPAQPVHGDLLGNVLFADGLPPAVIDWSVYERPALWASAVVVIDAISWHQAPATLVERYADRSGWSQVLIRALMYRIATSVGRLRSGQPVTEQPGAYEPVVELVAALAP